MTCRQIGGACEMVFSGESFDEIARLAKEHGNAMLEQGDFEHRSAMAQIRSLMRDPAAMAAWLARKRREFEALPDDSL